MLVRGSIQWGDTEKKTKACIPFPPDLELRQCASREKTSGCDVVLVDLVHDVLGRGLAEGLQVVQGLNGVHRHRSVRLDRYVLRSRCGRTEDRGGGLEEGEED